MSKQLIKRADGSYSQRGLWDNIRANKGSGRKPTKAMLEQEAKIKAQKKEDGGWLDDLHTENTVKDTIKKSRYVPVNETTATLLSPSKLYNVPKSFSPTKGQEFFTSLGVGAIPYLGDAVDIYNAIKSIQKNDPAGVIINTAGAFMPFVAGQTLQHGWDKAQDYANKYWQNKTAERTKDSKKKADGSWVTDSSIPSNPRAPYYSATGVSPMMSNRQMGNKLSSLPDGRIVDSSPQIPAYAHGATVWTNQDTSLWAAGTPTPTSTQAYYKNSRAISPESAVPYPEVTYPKSAKYFTQAPVMQGYNPYNGPMRLHAPDTTKMDKGGKVTSKYKNKVGIPYAISPGISNAGMHVGPTTQRGITFGSGGWLDKYDTGGPIYNWIPPHYPRVGARYADGGETTRQYTDLNEYKKALKSYNDSSTAYNLSRRNELLFLKDPFDPKLPEYNEEMATVAARTNLQPYKYKQGFTPSDIVEFLPGPEVESRTQSDEPWIALYKKPKVKPTYNPDIPLMKMRGISSVDINEPEPTPKKTKMPEEFPYRKFEHFEGDYGTTFQIKKGNKWLGVSAPEYYRKAQEYKEKTSSGWLDNL